MNEYRVQRATALAVALSTLIVPLISMVTVVSGQDITAMWWTSVSFALVLGAAVGLLVTAIAPAEAPERTDRLRTAALVLAAVNVVVVALWFPAWTGVAHQSAMVPPVWVANTAALPAVVLATVMSMPATLAYLGGVLALLGTAQQFARFGVFGFDGYLNGLMTLTLLGVFLAVLRASMRVARSVDAQRELVLAVAVDTAARSARVTERQRLDTVVRDSVIAVLRDVRPGRPDQRHRTLARAALAELDGGVGVIERGATTMTAARAAVYLKETVYALGADVLVAVDVADGVDDLPGTAVETLGDTVTEAVGNALTHAGPRASTAVVGRVGPEGIRVRVVDDGCGFDPSRVAPDRSGIAIGIIERLAGLPGGRAHVDSSPTRGTTVSLEWSRG